MVARSSVAEAEVRPRSRSGRSRSTWAAGIPTPPPDPPRERAPQQPGPRGGGRGAEPLQEIAFRPGRRPLERRWGRGVLALAGEERGGGPGVGGERDEAPLRLQRAPVDGEAGRVEVAQGLESRPQLVPSALEGEEDGPPGRGRRHAVQDG